MNNIAKSSWSEQSINTSNKVISDQEGSDQIEDCKLSSQDILLYFLTIVLGEWKSYDDRLV